MSERIKATSMTGNGSDSFRQTTNQTNNGVKFAGEESKDKMYEPKHTKKLIRVLTVVAYIFSVSLAAIMLSIYYVFLWNPRDSHPVLHPGNKNSSIPVSCTTGPGVAPTTAGPVPTGESGPVAEPYKQQQMNNYIIPQSRGRLSPTIATPLASSHAT